MSRIHTARKHLKLHVISPMDPRKEDPPRKRIIVNASDLAKYTGHNRYCKGEERWSTFWSSNKALAKSLGVEYKPRVFSHTENFCSQMSQTDKSAMCESLQIESGSTPRAIAQKLEARVVHPAVDQGTNAKATETMCVSSSEATKGMAAATITRAQEAFAKDVQLKRGIAREKQSIDEYEKKSGNRVVERNTRKLSKVICDVGEEYEIMLVGKIDGMLQDTGEVVEIKERRNRLFGCVVDYEKVQLHAYMILTSTTSSILRERFDSQSEEYSVAFDQEFWRYCLHSLRDFVHSSLGGKSDSIEPNAYIFS